MVGAMSAIVRRRRISSDIGIRLKVCHSCPFALATHTHLPSSRIAESVVANCTMDDRDVGLYIK